MTTPLLAILVAAAFACDLARHYRAKHRFTVCDRCATCRPEQGTCTACGIR